MKLLIVTAIKECRKDIAQIFADSGIEIYSVTNIHGVRNEEESGLTENWFGGEWKENYGSIMLFSFADEEAVQKALASIEDFNKRESAVSDDKFNHCNRFPIKGTVVPIEDTVGFY